MSPRPKLAIGIPLLVLALGCPAQRTTELEGDATRAAEIGGETLTVGEVDAWIKEQLFGPGPVAVALIVTGSSSVPRRSKVTPSTTLVSSLVLLETATALACPGSPR